MQQPVSSEEDRPPARAGITWRAVLIGSLGVIGGSLLYTYPALVLLTGGRGIPGLTHTSVPLFALDYLVLLIILSSVVGLLKDRLSLSRAELIVIYAMSAAGPAINGVGGVMFVVPTLPAAFWYATPENHWADLFHRFIPDWFGPKDPLALKGFYLGQSALPVKAWLGPVAIWTGFMFTSMFATLCVCSILRKQWLDRERLTFPTLFLPVELTQEDGGLLRDKLMWIACLGTFGLLTMNTIGANFPSVPVIGIRGEIDLGRYLVNPPWSAMGSTPITFLPAAIGLAYLIPLEVAFSCWFFYLMTKVQLVFGAMMGFGERAGSISMGRYPFFGYQGAGAFIGIAIFALWLGRRHLGQVFKAAFSRGQTIDDSQEPMSYRWAVWGLIISLAAMLVMFGAAGISPLAPAALIILGILYLIAGTRIWAQSGVAWLAGPTLEPYGLMTSSLGTGAFSPRTLTIMSYFRFITAHDLRYVAMPRQMDALKMADMTGINSRQMALVIMLALLVAMTVGFWSMLGECYQYGAEVKANSFFAAMGRQPFTLLASDLENPTHPDKIGVGFGAGAMAFTGLLMFLQTRLAWFPFHPIGYAFSNTINWTIGKLWVPFFIAWLVKLLLLRYGGMRLYRRGIPFFLGLILGDGLASGPAAILGCFYGFSVYISNW